jgi:anti-sigma regulatory factor (Ser/Thr protein kinase)
MRHEALLNVAFADTPVWILCPYDITGLDPRVVAEAEHTHPTIVDAGGRRASHGYREPADVYAARERPLPEPPEGSQEFAVTADLAALRRFVRTHAAAAGLDEERTANVLVAANEAASNTLLHGGRDGVARIWHDGDHMICEIADSGRIDDLLAGRRVPDDRQTSGRGLWLVNRLCDFAEVRSGPEATVLRLHMRLG